MPRPAPSRPSAPLGPAPSVPSQPHSVTPSKKGDKGDSKAFAKGEANFMKLFKRALYKAKSLKKKKFRFKGKLYTVK